MKKRMISRITAAVLAAGLLTLTACSGGASSAGTADASSSAAQGAASAEDAAGAGDLLARIQARGELIVATEGTIRISIPLPTMTRTTSWWATTWRWPGWWPKSWA